MTDDLVVFGFFEACKRSMQREMDFVMVSTVSAPGSNPFDNAKLLITQCQSVRQQMADTGKSISDDQFLQAVTALAFENYIPHTPFSERRTKCPDCK